MNDREIFDSQAISLAQIMTWGESNEEVWKPDELGAIFKHQLSAPLQVDFSNLSHPHMRRIQSLCLTASPPIESFADLLHHPRPPVELLEMTKEFAKICRSHAECRLPDEIATMLYTLSIAVALTKCNRRITKLDRQGLGYTFGWALSQSWLDPSTRELLEHGSQAIDREGPAADV
ncbi:MAG: hypothetical protein H8E44_33300 [Planctomycetes bacterium]|nr:hypothetical protein [Planctomycetota bacterium]MBL7038194.1 hypothetical protein [Pirellulaceae bacterium]